MIVYMNVCDQCGNQNEIQSGSLDSGVNIDFRIVPTYQKTENRGSYLGVDALHNKTFCDKECMLEWFKSHAESSGVIKVNTTGDDNAPF